MSFGATPLDGSSTPLPMSSAVPDGSTTPLALAGGPSYSDSGNSKVPVSMYVKDGNDLTQGVTTDAAVVSDANGTLSGKMRGLVKILADVWDSVNHRLKVDGSGVTQPVSISTLIAQAGEVALYGSNPVALTANTDAAVKWGASGTTAVNHTTIANNTTINVNYRLDAATTAGSDLLAPGQKITVDIAGTLAVHLQANGTPNLNGSTGGNIVIIGWL